MMGDPRMEEFVASMPFDGKRLIHGGFVPIVDEVDVDKPGYADGYIVAVAENNKDAYRAVASEATGHFAELGAIRTVEAWADDVPDGQLTDFRRAVKAKPDEAVVFSRMEFPSKDVRDAGWKRFMENSPMTGHAFRRSANASGRQGVVRLHFTIDRSGTVLNQGIARSSGAADLDEAGIAMVLRASPVPALPTDTSATFSLLVPVRFEVQQGYCCSGYCEAREPTNNNGTATVRRIAHRAFSCTKVGFRISKI